MMTVIAAGRSHLGFEGAYTAGVAPKPEIMRGSIARDGNRNVQSAEDQSEITPNGRLFH